MYILFNKDGSIFDTNISEYVMQGSNLVNVIYVAFVDSEYLDWSASGNFTLPDESNSVLVGVSTTFLYKGVNYTGWKITLTNNETKYDGVLNVSINLIKNEQTLYTYLFNITINETGYPLDGEWTTNVNYAQFNTLMAQIATKFGIGTTALTVEELPLQGSENIIYYLDKNGYYEQYMFNGSEYVLLGTTIFKSDIPTINVSNSGTFSEGDYQTLEENHTVSVIYLNNECILHQAKSALDTTSLYFVGITTNNEIVPTFICLKILENRNYTLTIKQLVDTDSEQTLTNKTVSNSTFNNGTINGTNINNSRLSNTTSIGTFKVESGSITYGEESDPNQTAMYQDNLFVRNMNDRMQIKAGVLDFSKNAGLYGHYLFNEIPDQSVYIAYSVSNENSNIDNAFLDVRNDIDSAKGDISSLQSLVNTINSTYASKTWVQEQGYGLQSDINEINSELSTINGSITTIKSDVNTLKSNVSTLQGNVGNMQSDVSTIKSNITTIENDVDSLQTKTNNLESSVDTINSKLNTVDTSIASIENNVESLETKTANLQNSVNTINGEIDTINSDLDNKLNKLQLSQGNLLYARVNGVDLGAVYDTEAQANTIVARDAQGHVIGATPTDATHLTTKSYVDSAVGSVSTIRFSIVDELPSTGESNIIYLVPNTTSSEKNVYDEYIWVNNAFEIIGSTAIDLSNYAKLDSDNVFTGVQYFNATSGILIDGFKLNNAFLTNWQTEINKIEGIETDISTVEGNINTLNTKVSANTTNIETNTNDIESINNDITTIKSNITSIESNVGDIENKVASLRTDVTALGTNVGANTQNINTINGEIDDINTELGSLTTNITNTQQAVLRLNNQVETNTSDITQINQDLNNKVDKTTTAGAYVNEGDSVVNIPVSNTPTANAIPRYDSNGFLKSASSTDYGTLDASDVITKETYENIFSLMFNSQIGIPVFALTDTGLSFSFDMFFGTTAGEEKALTLPTPTTSPLFKLFQKQKIFAIEGEYSQGIDNVNADTPVARIIVINSSAFETHTTGVDNEMFPPFYCTGVLPNKNYPYGLQFNMVVDFDVNDKTSITFKTKVYEPNSGGSGSVEIPTITISSLSGTLSDSDYEKLVNSDMAKLVSPYGTYTAFKATVPQQQNNLYYFVYLTDEYGTTCYSCVVTNGTTKTYSINEYTVDDFTPETITINMTSETEGTMSLNDFNKIKLGVPICVYGLTTSNKIAMFPFAHSNLGTGYLVQMLNYERGEQIVIVANNADVAVGIIRLYANVLKQNTFNEVQDFYQGLKAGNNDQLTINANGALSITDGNGTVGLSGQGLMYRVGGSTRILKMPTDSVSGTTEIVSKAYLDSQNFLKQENTTGALLTISNDNYIQLRSNIVNGGYFVVGNKTNTLPGFEVLDNSGNVVFDAKSKQGVVDIGTSTARMLFGSGVLPESKVVKFFTADNNNILTFGLGNDRLSIDFNGRVLFDVQTTTVSQDFNQVQSGDIAGRLDTGLTDEHIIITSIYDTTNQVEFMQPYYDGTKWYATAICVAQGISGTSNVQIKYIKLP